jgi:hypothetical protein
MPLDGVYEVGTGASKRGRLVVYLRVILVTPQLRVLLRTMPPGLARVLPELHRIGTA